MNFYFLFFLERFENKNEKTWDKVSKIFE